MWPLLSGLLSYPVHAQEPAEGPGAQAHELAPLVRNPELVEFVQAPFPEEALEAGVQGSVLLLIEIDETGTVTRAEVIESAGYGFDEAAIAAARQFVFSPAEDAEGPVPVAIEFEYGFVLEEQPPPEDEPDAPAPVNLEGTLLERGTARPLAGFAVTVEGTEVSDTTDEEGRFQLRGVPVGTVTVTSIQAGYETAQATVEVTDGEVTSFKLWMRNLSYRDDELVGVYRKEQEEITRRTIDIAEVRRIPGTFGDPVRVIQNLPGAARSPFGTGLLVIRGANPEDSPVYVDGIRIPFIYHLGGYVSVLNADLIEGVDYLPGGYGVQYGRSLGGVIDVTTKSEFPERNKLTWSTDALDSGGMFTGRVGKNDNWGVAVAARRSYIDFFIDSLVPLFTDPGWTVKPRWYDYQLKLKPLNIERGGVEAFVFGFQDVLSASSPQGFSQGTDQDTQGDLGTDYSTHRALVRWERPLSEGWTVTATPSLGVDYAAFNLGNELSIEQTLWIAELRSEAPWTASPALEITPGLDFIGIYYTFTSAFPLNPGDLGEYDPLAEREPWTVEGDGTVWSPDLFLDAEIRPLKERDDLLIKPGIRLNHVSVVDQYTAWSTDPRIMARARLLPGGTLKGGTGIYTQPPQPFESWRPDGGVALGYERAWSSEVGWEQALTATGLIADATVFYKELTDLIVVNPGFASLDDEYFVQTGLGEVRGLEVMVRQAPLGGFFGWVSYTLSESLRKDGPRSAWYPFELDQTHILVALAGQDLPRDYGVSAKFQYVTGNPYTPYAGGVYDVDQDFYFGIQSGQYNSERLPDYYALDLRADKLFTFKHWQLEVYLDLLNVLRGENPEFNIDNYDFTETRFIRGLPFIPSPGFDAKLEF